MRKVYIASMASVLTLAVVFGLRVGQAEAGSGLPLSKLAGNYAGEGSGTFGLCLNSTFSAVEACSTAPHAVFFSQTFVFQGTSDSSGNSCSTVTFDQGPEFPLPLTTADVFTLIEVGTNVSYTGVTQSGVESYKAYVAGAETFCNGSVLVNTAGAPVVTNSTSSFVVSQKGSRIDAVVLTGQNTPVADLTDVVGHSVAFRQ